jgi:Na+-transporting methylmalonyl-CoA/oxaloacetate decarboxylase gamma subunit
VAPITLICGILLIGVGAAGYLMQEAEGRSATALIPAGLGIVFLLLGLLAYKDNLRKHAMHLAAALGLLGQLLRKASKDQLTMGLATVCIVLMFLICSVFVGLCANSFTQARRRRSQGGPGPD